MNQVSSNSAPSKALRVLVLGGNGLIGSACAQALHRKGIEVVCAGREVETARAQMPFALWHAVDITLLDGAGWMRLLEGVHFVVNAAGALQDGARDSLQAIHIDMVSNLLASLEGTGTGLVHISAAGVSAEAPSWFMRSKWQGDQLIAGSNLKWWILRPTLVLSSRAYGGTALLRAGAATPWFGLVPFADAPVQTVHVDDLANAAVSCVLQNISPRTQADITGAEQHTLLELFHKVRAWQGYRPWRGALRLPQSVAMLAGRVADALSWAGWRSPLRTSALVSLKAGVTGDASQWTAAGGAPCRELAQILADLPCGTQERWFARLYLLLPLAIAVLSVFWIASGLIGLWQYEAAMAVLTERGFGLQTAYVAVLSGAFIDIALGAAIVFRRWVRPAALGMILCSAGYLAAASVWTPDLWADPLGSLFKVLPGMALAGLVAALVEKR